jgi:NADP-dependent 3-hydroxy acid dehydrogenase YdfG
VISALLADWPEENLRLAKESGSLIEPAEVADAVEYMLTRSRNVTIRDMLVLPPISTACEQSAWQVAHSRTSEERWRPI